jgi:hypothetical protein
VRGGAAATQYVGGWFVQDDVAYFYFVVLISLL